MKMITKTIVAMLATFTITACNNGSKSSSNTIDLYSDKAQYQDNDITVSFSGLGETDIYGDMMVSFTLNLVSSNPKPIDYSLLKPKIIRESNEAEYSVSPSYIEYSTFRLECDIEKNHFFSATIPTSISEEKYYFYFELRNKSYRYHLYEYPDELRKSISLHYNIDGQKKETISILEGKRLSLYDWISEDYIYVCHKWYFDAAYEQPIEDTFQVDKEMTVYGKKEVILNYYSSGNSPWYVSGANYIPSTHEIVIPKRFQEKDVHSIEAGSFNNFYRGMKEFFIPKTVRIYGSNNFYLCEDLKTVHFEGTEQEWSEMNQVNFKESIRIVFNSYK